VGKVQTNVGHENFTDIKLLKTKYCEQTFIRKHYLNKTMYAIAMYMRLICNDTDANNAIHKRKLNCAYNITYELRVNGFYPPLTIDVNR